MNNRPVLRETLILLAMEAGVCLITALIYAALDFSGVLPDIFTYRVVTGLLLGTTVTVFNFFFLAVATDRAFSKALEERGTAEMTEEEAEQFAAQNRAGVQSSVLASQLIRTLFLIGALVLAFVLPWFDGIAAVIPLLAFRPLLMLREFFRKEK